MLKVGTVTCSIMGWAGTDWAASARSSCARCRLHGLFRGVAIAESRMIGHCCTRSVFVRQTVLMLLAFLGIRGANPRHNLCGGRCAFCPVRAHGRPRLWRLGGCRQAVEGGGNPNANGRRGGGANAWVPRLGRREAWGSRGARSVDAPRTRAPYSLDALKNSMAPLGLVRNGQASRFWKRVRGA